MIKTNVPVVLDRCETYDVQTLRRVLSQQWKTIGVDDAFFRQKKVVIKPNLVRKMDPALGATTHPALIQAAAELILQAGAAEVRIAESPGGPYSEGALRGIYRVCGTEKAARDAGIGLNYQTDWRQTEYPEGIASKTFHIIEPILNADVIVNLCKLKTHGLTMMSGAVKNYFGTVPGTEKFEMHARFPDIGDFSEMLVDLCAMHTTRHDTLNVIDAIVGMEGNGPTNGSPRKIGALISSENPFAADLVGAELIGMSGKVIMLNRAMERGLVTVPRIISSSSAGQRELDGQSELEKLRVTDFLPPDSEKVPILTWLSTFWDGRLMKFFEPRPKINASRCVGCGECVRSCPVHTIMLNQKKKQAVIHPEACIKCFCCQELCPKDAVKVRQNFLIKLVK